MKTRRLYLASLLLASLSVQLAFGWGNATHVYFAKELGAKFGLSNMNEMYGCLLPDLANFDLSDGGVALAGAMHNNAMLVWAAANSPAQKSLAFGFLTHNQTWGADYTAHIKAPGFPHGYIVEKGIQLAPSLVPELLKILAAATKNGAPFPITGDPATGIAQYLAPLFGHDLSETAIDLLVKRNIDRAIGARMVLAAKSRPANAYKLLAEAFGTDPDVMKGPELEYQQYVIGYGTAFVYPENQTIAALSAQTAQIAKIFIETALAKNGLDGVTVEVTAAQVTDFINAAIKIVKNDYSQEVAKTLCFIEKGLRQHGIRNGCQLFAHDAAEEAVESADLSMTPETFSLAQNSPNPFNPSTAIAFTLPAQAHVRLTIFNALGQEIATLVDDERPAGAHIAHWDAMNQPSGAYFYRIESGSFVETKRMMLVK